MNPVRKCRTNRVENRIVNAKERRKGVALIISVGILALLAMIATSFAINMQLEYKAAVNQFNYTKAAALAEAGIEKVVADIRNKAKTSAYSEVITSFPDDYATGEVTLGDGTYEVTIEHEDQKVNISALDETDYIWIDRLNTAGLSYADIAKIIDYRDEDSNVTTQILTSTGLQVATGNETNTKNAPYATVEEVKLVLKDDNKYNAIKNDITVSVPIIKGGLIGEYYSQRTGFTKDTVLDLDNYKGKVIELGAVREAKASGSGPWGTFPGTDGPPDPNGDPYGWSEAHDGEWAGGYIAEDWSVGFGLEQFGVVFRGFIYIPADKVNQSITFYIRSDDGCRFFVDGEGIINIWQDRFMDPEVTATHTFTYAGWHPMRIDYYDQGGTNGLELHWNGLGSKDYVPAEYLGYCPASYYGKIFNLKTGTYITPTTLYTDYNSAGIFKVISKGRVKRSDGTLLAEKQIATILQVFGTWSQTTKAEFYAPWFSVYGDFSDGEIKNVNWMDSCPKNASDDLEVTGYFDNENNFVRDSLKLGYWDNFDEDVAYSVVNLRGDAIAEIYGAAREWWQGWIPWATWGVSFGEFGDYDADGDNEFKIYAAPKKEVRARLNENYYYSDASSLYDLFLRAWEKDKDSPTERRTNPEVDGDGNPLPALYEPSWAVAYLYAKGPVFDISNPWPGAEPFRYNTLLADGDNDIFGLDKYEVNLEWGNALYENNIYRKSKVLALVAVGTTYQGFLDGQPKLSHPAGNPNKEGVVKMLVQNLQFTGWDAWATAVEERLGNYWDGQFHYFGCGTANEAYFDSIRLIPKRGYFVSKPFVSAFSSEDSNINWATISWNDEPVSNTDIDISVRAGDALGTTDTGWTNVSNGSALSVTGKQIQYKAVLSTSALNTSSYNASGVTPILKDITVTYLPQVEIIFWRQERE